jgi:hypothetical protein
MKILFENKIQNTGIVSLNADGNYPVDNVKDIFLRRIYKSTTVSDALTITFPTDTEINCFYILHTNATATIRLYNGVTLLSTLTGLTNHFSTVTVTKIEVDIIAPTQAYIGEIGVGIERDILKPSSFWDENYEDRSLVSESDTGQVLQEYVEPLYIYQFTFDHKTREQARAMQSYYVGLGRGRPVFIDPEADGLPTLYAQFTSALSTNKQRTLYTVVISLKEAR